MENIWGENPEVSKKKSLNLLCTVLAWRILGMGEPDGLPSMGSHRVGHDWGNVAAAALSHPGHRRAGGGWICWVLGALGSARGLHRVLREDQQSSFRGAGAQLPQEGSGGVSEWWEVIWQSLLSHRPKKSPRRTPHSPLHSETGASTGSEGPAPASPRSHVCLYPWAQLPEGPSLVEHGALLSAAEPHLLQEGLRPCTCPPSERMVPTVKVPVYPLHASTCCRTCLLHLLQAGGRLQPQELA